MTKVERIVYEDGRRHLVEHAVCVDGTSPSLIAISEMEAGEWSEDPELGEIPDDEQIRASDLFRVGIEHFAAHGVPNNSYCTVNNLNEGVWEFRRAKMRISFYDTCGDGTFTPKYRIRHVDDAEFEDDFWWLPDFDDFLRLGHAFGKRGQLTEEFDLKESLRVRKEDLSHDE